MNKLQIFNNPEFGQVRTIQEEGRVLFCGSDVAKALGYIKPQKAIADHCKGALKRSTPTRGGKQLMLFIPEGDIYRLAAKSELPGADRFESWIFDEVLPSIRKTGSYSAKSNSANKKLPLASFNHLMEINVRQMKAANIDPKRQAAWVNDMTREALTPFGINVPMLTVGVSQTYDKEQIAKELGVYSKSGKPHSQAIAAIIRTLNVPVDMIEHSPFAANGHSDDYDRFKAPVLDMVHDWINAHGKTSPIMLDKRYNVSYR